MSYEPLAGWNGLFCYGGLKRFYQTIEQTGEAKPGSLPSGFHVSTEPRKSRSLEVANCDLKNSKR